MQFIRNPGQANETRLGLTTSGTPLANGDVLRVMTPGAAATAIRRGAIRGGQARSTRREDYG
jgi:hypothetical protein